MTEEAKKLLDSLTEHRMVQVYIPDISLEEAMKNEPYVLRVDCPPTYSFLDVLQIEDPLHAQIPLQGRTTLAYAFMVDPTKDVTHRFYITSLLPDVSFPWYSPQDGEEEVFMGCQYLGITTHSGVPVTHVRVSPPADRFDQFEEEIRSIGYRLVIAKRYDRGAALSNLYKARSQDGSMAQQVQPAQSGVAAPHPESTEEENKASR